MPNTSRTAEERYAEPIVEREVQAPDRINNPRNLRRHGRIAVEWAVRLRRYPAALAVAIVLSSHAQTQRVETGGYGRVCWPTEQAIADELGISERAVRSAIDTLKEAGFVRVRERRFQKSTLTWIWDYQPKTFAGQ